MPRPTLRPYQQRLLARWAGLPAPRRLLLAWDMGAGKTIGALEVVRAQGARKILIICPALVRAQWAREADKWLDGLQVGVVYTGSSIKSSKPAQARRAEALAKDVVIVSFDLLGTVPRAGYDFIIIDEFHALRSPSSKQSQTVRSVFHHNPTAAALGLSGTPIPNEAKQLWNPVDTFFPGVWGKQTRPGWEPWAFVSRFCKKEVSEYGTRYYGLRENKASELAERFARVSDRVVQADFANYLPPLYVEPLEIGAKEKSVTLVKGWLNSLPESAQHVGIYCHLRETARAIHAALPGSLYIDGSLSSNERDDILNTARECTASTIVATTHSLAEGISLSFQKAAFIVEWTSDVANVVQFLGRFSRQDSTSMAPTRVNVAIGPNDISAAETIRQRVANINCLIRASRSTDAAAEAFAEQEMSDDAFFAQLQSIAVSHEKRARLWAAGDDDDVEED